MSHTRKPGPGSLLAVLAVTLSLAAAIAVFGPRAEAQAPGPSLVDPKLSVRTVASGLVTPTSMAFLGADDMLVLEKQTGGGNAEEDTRVALVQIMFPLAANAAPADRQKVTAQAESVSKQAKSCGEMARIGREQAPQTSGEIGKLRVGDLPPELRKTVLGLQVAEASPPLPLRGGIGVLMVCERENSANALPSREQIGDDLARERFESMAQRYLRDLRRSAFVDMRV